MSGPRKSTAAALGVPGILRELAAVGERSADLHRLLADAFEAPEAAIDDRPRRTRGAGSLLAAPSGAPTSHVTVTTEIKKRLRKAGLVAKGAKS